MPRRALREIVVIGDTARVPLSRGLWAVVDACDAPLVAGRHWHAAERRTTSYAISNCRPSEKGPRSSVYMHRLLVGVHEGLLTDHINGDGLDNRRSNLRLVTAAQNALNCQVRGDNTSGAVGVSWYSRQRRWRAYLNYAGERIWHAYFDSRDEAIAAREAVASHFFGQFRRSR